MQVNGDSPVDSRIALQQAERSQKALEVRERVNLVLSDVEAKLATFQNQPETRIDAGTVTIILATDPDRPGLITSLEHTLDWQEQDLNSFPERKAEFKLLYDRIYEARCRCQIARDAMHARTQNVAGRIMSAAVRCFRWFEVAFSVSSDVHASSSHDSKLA